MVGRFIFRIAIAARTREHSFNAKSKKLNSCFSRLTKWIYRVSHVDFPLVCYHVGYIPRNLAACDELAVG
jgi:hypothetical protein